MRLNFAGLLLLILIAAAAFYAAVPWFAFRSMRDAARTGDIAALAQVIDYPALDANFAAEISGRPIEPPPPSPLSDPVGALQHMFNPPAPASPLVERYLEPQVLAALADGRPPNSPLPAGAAEPFPKVAFWGPDRCRIVVADPGAPARRTEFTFQRRGVYSWKLTRIVWPEQIRMRRP